MASILQNRIVIILISLIWGFGLALLFRRVCQNDQCVVVKVPPLFDENNNIIYDNKSNKCYKLEKYSSQCIY
ncbi:hypothetical protein QJ856_gp0953 [Tupanvirus deep ocean]|uniref:Uncharacterized protein n=2 Tax=Tupanvirus TaxID=2094720 RepID=A0AC62A7V3_9VIRU|nr:hypothetical protein QJ856_gp0953 [Tupanvirus deep ocean]QKU33804.1 hypothetical protein [Tupanvirus deep ocean]